MSKMTIDLNPAYVYVEPGTPNSMTVAQEVCAKAHLKYYYPLPEPLWHRAYGQ
jgi:hypothetical protein